MQDVADHASGQHQAGGRRKEQDSNMRKQMDTNVGSESFVSTCLYLLAERAIDSPFQVCMAVARFFATWRPRSRSRDHLCQRRERGIKRSGQRVKSEALPAPAAPSRPARALVEGLNITTAQGVLDISGSGCSRGARS